MHRKDTSHCQKEFNPSPGKINSEYMSHFPEHLLEICEMNCWWLPFCAGQMCLQTTRKRNLVGSKFNTKVNTK